MNKDMKDLIGFIVLVLALLLLVWLLTPTIIKRLDEQDRAHEAMIEDHAKSVVVN